MGFTTRIDVPLRAFVPSSDQRSARHETFTDLDVLGVALGPGFSLRTIIADCKTTQRRSTERMFWVRGVSDFFGADEAWMVRTGGVAAAARQLAARLRISVLEPTDLARLQQYHPFTLPAESVAFLFDEAQVAAARKAFTSVDKKLVPLVEYREFDYWVYDEHRNLLQVVAHLAQAHAHLDPAHPTHRALFLDYAWLYALSLARAAQHVRAVHISDIDPALQEYLFGGQMAFREKQRLADLLERVAPKGSSAGGVLPGWYPQLLELLTRHLRRPHVVGDELRYAEWASEAQLAKHPDLVADAFGSGFSDVAAKLLADVCGFLVTAANLDPDFRRFARTVFGQREPGADSDRLPTDERPADSAH